MTFSRESLDLRNRAYYAAHEDDITLSLLRRSPSTRRDDEECPAEDAEICGACASQPAGADCVIHQELLSKLQERP